MCIPVVQTGMTFKPRKTYLNKLNPLLLERNTPVIDPGLMGEPLPPPWDSKRPIFSTNMMSWQYETARLPKIPCRHH